ncbi:MAG: serine/threonine protein kinase [Proteobacteria bacterium]|nr:serine/threonine protein kinase [Pseudomonadota bacterium]
MSFEPGKTLVGRYRLSESIGGGAMGEVFKAEHTLMKKMVAIKLLHASASGNQELVERFRREAQSAAAIQHPNMCAVTDFDVTEDGTFFLVMEYLDGETLQGRLNRVRCLDPLTTIHIMTQLLSVLQSAHACGIVHRDVKPENIFLIQQDGTRDLVKLLDFGIARQSETATASSSQAKLTQAGFIYGTPQYMAPEQASGDTIDFRADLYACGVILYEMITGKRPFISDNIVSLLGMHCFEPPPHLEPDAIEHADQFDAIIQKLLMKNRKERFQSARDVARALEAVKNGLSCYDAPPASEKTDNVLANQMHVKISSGLSALSSTIFTALPVKRTRGLILAAACAILLVALFVVMHKSDNARPLPIAEPPVAYQSQDNTPHIQDGTYQNRAQGVSRLGTPHIQDDTPHIQDAPQPFDYDEKYQISHDAVLSKDQAVISAVGDLYVKNFDIALEKLDALYSKYETHPNFMRLYVLTLHELKRHDDTLHALDKLLTLVPDALRSKSIQEVVFFLIVQKNHSKPTMDVLQNHTSTEAVISLSDAIINSPFNGSDDLKKRLRVVFEAMPQDDIPEWRRLAAEVWTMPKEQCKDRLKILIDIANSDIPPPMLRDILRALRFKRECEEKKGRSRIKTDCNACMRPWIQDTEDLLRAQRFAPREAQTPPD